MEKKSNFPPDLIDPKEKGKDWLLQYNEAVWSSRSDMGQIFYNASSHYNKYRLYAQGDQPIAPYMPLMGVTEGEDETLLNIDWSVLPIVPKYRRIALAILKKIPFEIVATPIDPIALKDKHKYFAEQKANIELKEELAGIPGVDQTLPSSLPDDPADQEELEIKKKYGYKHNMAIECEQTIEVVHNHNKYEKIDSQIKEDLFDVGVGIGKDSINSNGAIEIERVDPSVFITGYSESPDFKGVSFMGQVKQMSVSEIKKSAGDQIKKEDYETIQDLAVGKNGKSAYADYQESRYGKYYDDMKVEVLDLEIKTVDSLFFEKRKNKYNNKKVGRTRFNKKGATRKDIIAIYKSKWVVGTDIMWDYGLDTDIKRAKNKLHDAEFSYHVYASGLYKGKATGMMQQIIPNADAIQLAWYRFQNALAEAIPQGINFNLDAMENVPLGQGGEALKPHEIADLYKKKRYMFSRSLRLDGGMTKENKPFEVVNASVGSEVVEYYNIINGHIERLRDILGFNELTDGSTPDARTLVRVAEKAKVNTDHSLYHLAEASKYINEGIAESIVTRAQDILSKGNKIEGYIQALGNETKKFFSVNPKMSMHEFAIKIEQRSDDLERELLYADIDTSLKAGIIELEDAVMVRNIENTKLAEQILSHRVKKRKEEKRRQEVENIEINAKTQQESAVAAEREKQATQQLKTQGEIAVELEKRKTLLEVEKVKSERELLVQSIQAENKLEVKELESDTKEDVAEINAMASISKQSQFNRSNSSSKENGS